MALHGLLSSLAVALGAEGARIARKRSSGDASMVKFIAEVPVLNYHTAYGGRSSLSVLNEAEQEWVLVMKTGTSQAQMHEICQMNRRSCNLIAKGGAPFVELRGTEHDLDKVLRTAGAPVKFVEPDQEVTVIPDIEAQAESATWGLGRIGAERRSRAGAGATIFVLDTGVRVSHMDFSGRALPALDVSSGAPVECDGDSSCAGDLQGHGTHCAGTAAGNTFGVAPSAKLQAIKVLSDQGSGSVSWSYYALGWLADSDERPAVASMSLGTSGIIEAFKEAVDGAVNAGIVVVVAAGNSNGDACSYSPAFVPNAIAVGSTTSLDVRSPFSNYGSCVQIWAPGSDVLSASHDSDFGARSRSGTSMACPHVSGAAALLLEVDPSKKSSTLLQAMLDNAVVNTIAGLRDGDTNALLYVGEGGAPPTPEPAPTPAPVCPLDSTTGEADPDGDCMCLGHTECFENGVRKCTYSLTEQSGYKTTRYYLASMSDVCKCL